MQALLDTHTLLWWVTNNQKPSQTVRDIIADSNNTLYVSVASSWEIIIKAKTGKFPLPEPATQFIQSALLHEGGLRKGRGMVSFSYHTKTKP